MRKQIKQDKVRKRGQKPEFEWRANHSRVRQKRNEKLERSLIFKMKRNEMIKQHEMKKKFINRNSSGSNLNWYLSSMSMRLIISLNRFESKLVFSLTRNMHKHANAVAN